MLGTKTSMWPSFNILVVVTATIINIPLSVVLSQQHSSWGHRLISLSSLSPQATNTNTMTFP